MNSVIEDSPAVNLLKDMAILYASESEGMAPEMQISLQEGMKDLISKLSPLDEHPAWQGRSFRFCTPP